MAKKKRPKPQPGPAAKRQQATGSSAPTSRTSTPKPAPTDDGVGADPDEHPLQRYRVAILIGFTVVGILGALLVAFSLQSRNEYSCRGTDVAAGTTTAGTDRGALDRLLATTPSLPTEGWQHSEPNRWSRSADGTTMVADISQADDSTFEVTRYDVCGFNLP